MSSTNWIQHAGNTMPTVNSDNTLTFNGGVNEYIADSYLLDSTQDFEITVEFDNNTTSSGTHDFAMFLIGEPMGSNPPLMILRQQGYNAWGANNSFFFGLYDGSSSYTSSGAGPAQLASGAMRIKKTGSLYEFFSSSDKVAFTKMGEINAAGQPFDSVDPLKVVIKTGSRTTEVSGYSNSQQPALTDGLIAKYALNTNGTDSVSSNDLSVVGGTVSYAGYGTNQAAAEFNFGELKSDNVIDLTDKFTVSFWAYEGTPYSYYNNNYSSFFRYGTAAGSYFDLYLLNGKIRTMHNNATSGWGDNLGSVTVPAGWNHYAMTIDPSNGSKIVYLNGVAQTLSGPAFTGTFASSQEIRLGNTSNNSAFRSNGGKMDDTRIWNRVLSASEIAGLHASGAETYTPTPETTLVAHYTFDDLTDGAGSYDLTAFDGASVSGGVMTFPNTTGGMKPSSKIPLASEFTVSLWFKNLKDRSLAQANFLMFTGNRGTVNDYLFCIYHNDELAAFKGGMISSGYSMTHLTHSGWHHLVAVYDNGTLTYYVDGVQAGNSISYANSGEIELFGSFDGAYEYAPADEMDDIRVYSMALDATQVSTLYTETTVSEEQGSGSSYDWTHSGQLTNIVKFVRGQDLNGNPSYAYAKKEDDNTTTLYFTPDLTNFAAFNSYDSGASSIDGSPIFIEYGAGGKVLVGTDTGKVYQIELDEYSVPQSYALLHDVVGGHPINSLKYGYAMNQWIFEAGGDIYTIPAAGGGAVLRHTLPAGAKVIDFAEGDEGKVAFIVRMADFSIEPRMAPADWSVIYGPSSMVADASVATDFNYSHAMDLWVSSNADGSNIVTVSDLLDYLS